MNTTISLVFLLAAVLSVWSSNPPLWPKKFIAGSSTALGYPGIPKKQFGGLIYYDYTRDAMWSVILDPFANAQGILNVNKTVWMVDTINKYCCIDPRQNGVGPPRPDWLQGAEYMGQMIIGDTLCEGWNRTDDGPEGISFQWFVSVASGLPKRMTNFAFLSDFSYFVTDDSAWPEQDVFAVPSYCPHTITNPNCSITQIFDLM